MFDNAKLEASQRALAHAVDVLRLRASAAAAATATAKYEGGRMGSESHGRPWLAVSPEGLCVALRACVDNARAGGGRGTGRRGIAQGCEG